MYTHINIHVCVSLVCIVYVVVSYKAPKIQILKRKSLFFFYLQRQQYNSKKVMWIIRNFQGGPRWWRCVLQSIQRLQGFIPLFFQEWKKATSVWHIALRTGWGSHGISGSTESLPLYEKAITWPTWMFKFMKVTPDVKFLISPESIIELI